MIVIVNIFDAVILGLVEGITEFLPISSTGHLILFGKILNVSDVEFLKSFNVAIQLGAILSVLSIFYKRFFRDFQTLKKIFIAFVPTVILGFIFYAFIKKYLLNNILVVLVALFVGGVLLIIFEKYYFKQSVQDNTIKDITFKQSFLIGIFQSIAIIPGISRSAATILGGMSLGVSRVAIVEFSFLLAVPTMFSATIFDIYKSFGNFSALQFPILAIGFFVSFLTAIFVIKLFLRFVKNNSFIFFGVYRILMASLFWVIFF